jgi:hypothetical protein
MLLNRLRVDPIVLPMRADEAYVYDAIRVVDPNDKSVLVAANIEHNTTIAQDARVAKFPAGSPVLL